MRRTIKLRYWYWYRSPQSQASVVSSGTLFYGSAPGPLDFFSLSTRRSYSPRSSYYARGTCGWSMIATTGRERRKDPTGRKKGHAAWDIPAATPISDVAAWRCIHLMLASRPRFAHTRTHDIMYLPWISRPSPVRFHRQGRQAMSGKQLSG